MNYPGGKNGPGIYQTIINQMPPHSMYIEAFAGSAAVLRYKRPALANIAIDSDARASERLRSTLAISDDEYVFTVICDDAISWLEQQAAANAIPDDALVYCDPPYLMETRRSKRRIYSHEMTMLQHRQLLRCLRTLKCFVILSGYWSKLYADALSDWRTITFQARTRGGSLATEWLWMNYPEPFELHDYRFLGQNFRQRERIKRQQARWLARLEHMEPSQRYAMLDVIDQLRDRTAINGEGGHPR